MSRNIVRVLLKTFSTVFNQLHSFVTTICNCRFKKCQVSVTNQTTKTSNVYLLASFANALLIRFTSPSPSRKPRKECVTNQKNVCAIDHICTTDFILVTRHQRKLNKQAHFFFFHLQEVLSSICNIFPAGKSCSAETGVKEEGTVSISLSAKYL